ncbi:unnamed protein product [Phaedon cochleariae]|uniref:PWWP domain-containing protein n=1 Tax=Phaedon cochleariae TaxID=80249 RepID=A0A9N9SJ97_PHACE|nr:unnamed protein product [Phaedon cochleariae]
MLEVYKSRPTVFTLDGLTNAVINFPLDLLETQPLWNLSAYAAVAMYVQNIFPIKDIKLVSETLLRNSVNNYLTIKTKVPQEQTFERDSHRQKRYKINLPSTSFASSDIEVESDSEIQSDEDENYSDNPSSNELKLQIVVESEDDDECDRIEPSQQLPSDKSSTIASPTSRILNSSGITRPNSAINVISSIVIPSKVESVPLVAISRDVEVPTSIGDTIPVEVSTSIGDTIPVEVATSIGDTIPVEVSTSIDMATSIECIGITSNEVITAAITLAEVIPINESTSIIKSTSTEIVASIDNEIVTSTGVVTPIEVEISSTAVASPIEVEISTEHSSNNTSKITNQQFTEGSEVDMLLEEAISTDNIPVVENSTTIISSVETKDSRNNIKSNETSIQVTNVISEGTTSAVEEIERPGSSTSSLGISRLEMRSELESLSQQKSDKYKYKIGDIILGKEKGYTYWPCKISMVKALSYKVKFYGRDTKGNVSTTWRSMEEDLDILEDALYHQIMILDENIDSAPRVPESDDKKRGKVSSKRHCCFYCNKPVFKVYRHYIDVHGKEKEVRELAILPPKSQQRKILPDKLRKQAESNNKLTLVQPWRHEVIHCTYENQVPEDPARSEDLHEPPMNTPDRVFDHKSGPQFMAMEEALLFIIDVRKRHKNLEQELNMQRHTSTLNNKRRNVTESGQTDSSLPSTLQGSQDDLDLSQDNNDTQDRQLVDVNRGTQTQVKRTPSGSTQFRRRKSDLESKFIGYTDSEIEQPSSVTQNQPK